MVQQVELWTVRVSEAHRPADKEKHLWLRIFSHQRSATGLGGRCVTKSGWPVPFQSPICISPPLLVGFFFYSK